jgi:hypothetical protein
MQPGDRRSFKKKSGRLKTIFESHHVTGQESVVLTVAVDRDPHRRF